MSSDPARDVVPDETEVKSIAGALGSEGGGEMPGQELASWPCPTSGAKLFSSAVSPV